MNGPCTFLVEDNPTIQDNLVSALHELAAANVIAIAASEDDAVTWLAGHKGVWDLAVVDLFLKQGNGIGVVRWCVGREVGQRVVVLTNYANEDVRARCLAAGADRVFDKSTELDAFFDYCSSAGHRGDKGHG